MGLFNNGKKAAKFAFITMPGAALGWNRLTMGNRYIADLWRSLWNPACPKCDKGVLSIHATEENLTIGKAHTDGAPLKLYPWTCSNCDFAVLEEADITKARDATARFRAERVKVFLAEAPSEERDTYERSHRLHSRAYFGATTLGAAGLLYMVASGAGFLVIVNWLCATIAMWTLGMKKSYRAWQVHTGTVFVDGAFWLWLKHEKWMI